MAWRGSRKFPEVSP